MFHSLSLLVARCTTVALLPCQEWIYCLVRSEFIKGKKQKTKHNKLGLGKFDTCRTCQRNGGKQQVICLTNLYEWMAEWEMGEVVKRQTLLRAAWDMRLWRATTRRDMVHKRKKKQKTVNRLHALPSFVHV